MFASAHTFQPLNSLPGPPLNGWQNFKHRQCESTIRVSEKIQVLVCRRRVDSHFERIVELCFLSTVFWRRAHVLKTSPMAGRESQYCRWGNNIFVLSFETSHTEGHCHAFEAEKDKMQISQPDKWTVGNSVEFNFHNLGYIRFFGYSLIHQEEHILGSVEGHFKVTSVLGGVFPWEKVVKMKRFFLSELYCKFR